ncbi:hypothetical protein PR048_003139 [Dryococelus australis]|uniref:Uncharacterized protein n=1 Tax=Dryococelus australis TaxID=614101 RepID=A0ABQ9INJ6_9NEOP|nr:hypothetical protein PR048_003139 [Dryococelus australis]
MWQIYRYLPAWWRHALYLSAKKRWTENPPTSVIVRHDSHIRKSGSEQANRSATAAPENTKTWDGKSWPPTFCSTTNPYKAPELPLTTEGTSCVVRTRCQTSRLTSTHGLSAEVQAASIVAPSPAGVRVFKRRADNLLAHAELANDALRCPDILLPGPQDSWFPYTPFKRHHTAFQAAGELLFNLNALFIAVDVPTTPYKVNNGSNLLLLPTAHGRGTRIQSKYIPTTYATPLYSGDVFTVACFLHVLLHSSRIQLGGKYNGYGIIILRILLSLFLEPNILYFSTHDELLG